MMALSNARAHALASACLAFAGWAGASSAQSLGTQPAAPAGTPATSPAQEPQAEAEGPTPIPLEPISLPEALARASARNVELEIARSTREAAWHRARGSWGAFDPVFALRAAVIDGESEGPTTLSGATVLETDTQTLASTLDAPLTTGGNFQLGFDTDNTKSNSQFAIDDVLTRDTLRLAYTQPLLRGAWTRYATVEQRLARVAAEQEDARLRSAQEGVLARVARAYWDLAAAREQVNVRELALKLGEEQLDQERRRLEVGVGTEVDLLQAQTNVAQSAEQLLLARTTVRAASDALRALLTRREREGERAGDSESKAGATLGFDEYAASWEREYEPTTALPEVAEPETRAAERIEWSACLASALEHRAELAERRLGIDAALARIDRAVSDRRPLLDLELSVFATGLDGDSEEAFDKTAGFDFPTAQAALAFSTPLRNRTARYELRAARAELRSAHLAYEQRELEIATEVRAAVRDVLYQVQAVSAARTSRAFAERQLAAEQSRFAQGASTTFQVLDFQQQLSAALSTERAAQAAFAKAQVELLRVQGLLTSDIAQVP
jgi:outer membrane protein